MNNSGKFVISLDFELFWGVRDLETLVAYGENILGVWQALPRMLNLFEKYGIEATFATVGFLFASTKKEMEFFLPNDKPQYLNSNLSPYNSHFNTITETEQPDKYHFASELIGLIQQYPQQEIATHTFSHYYCLEEGQGIDDFRGDIRAAIAIAKTKNIDLKSLVFPRNQMNESYLEVCSEFGIDSYRGNERAWYYNSGYRKVANLAKRALRLIDTYVNISGHNCSSIGQIAKTYPYNIPSSRFLRPYPSKLGAFENMRLKRIQKNSSNNPPQNRIHFFT